MLLMHLQTSNLLHKNLIEMPFYRSKSFDKISCQNEKQTDCLCLIIWKKWLFYIKLLYVCKIMQGKIPMTFIDWWFMALSYFKWFSCRGEYVLRFEILILGKVLNHTKCNKNWNWGPIRKKKVSEWKLYFLKMISLVLTMEFK